MPLLQKRIHFWLAGHAGVAVVHLLHASWRVDVHDPHAALPGIRDGSAPAIVAFWHRHIMSMMAHYRGWPVCVPVSTHRDGEYVAHVIERSGLVALRGSTRRGSANVVRGIKSQLGRGMTLAITPDGPLGPKFTVKPGIARLAESTGLPVHPIGLAARNAWILNSWDAFVVPKPWTQVAIVFGPPLRAEANQDVDAFCQSLKCALDSATGCARERVGLPPDEA